MRSYCAIYVDVGYLLAAAATRVTGTSLRRGVYVDHPALIQALMDKAEEDSGLPLLRVNWYDSGARPGGMPDFVQDEIGLLPRVKLRLGRLSHAGEQKGVDLRIGLDLATHGRNRVVDVIYLVSGDDDLTEAVEEAQGHGVQVILLAVPGHDGRPHGVARHLQRAADGLVLLDGETVDQVVRSRAIPEELIPDEFRVEEEITEERVVTVVASGVAVEVGAGVQREEDAEESPAVEKIGAPEEEAAAGKTAADGKPAASRAEGGAATAGVGAGSAKTGGAGEPGSDAELASVGSGTGNGVPSPTPSLFAKKKATTLVPPPEPVWTTATDQAPYGSYVGVTPELITTVARLVVRSWCATATPEDLATLKQQRPSIPPDLDRALLMDLSNRSEQYDIDEASRHDLRARFWQILDQVKLT